MNTSTILRAMAAVALLGGFSAASASHLPSPCAGGEPGDGTNCMYLVAGGGAANVYDGVTGNRVATTSTTVSLDVWMDFSTQAVQGGGFDIALSGDTANVVSMTWAWGPDFTAGEQTLDGSQFDETLYEGIQFDDFAGNGFGGTTGTQPGFSLVGTLTVQLSGVSNLLAQIQQPYSDATFPNCFAPGAGSGGSGCVDTNFYNLEVNAVPLPAAVWLMIGGLGTMAGFARRRA